MFFYVNVIAEFFYVKCATIKEKNFKQYMENYNYKKENKQ